MLYACVAPPLAAIYIYRVREWMREMLENRVRALSPPSHIKYKTNARGDSV